jgi:hypothetical protein
MFSYCYVSSWSVLKTDATQDPRWAMLIRTEEPLGMWRPGFPSQVARYGGQVVRSHPSVINRRVER